MCRWIVAFALLIEPPLFHHHHDTKHLIDFVIHSNYYHYYHYYSLSRLTRLSIWKHMTFIYGYGRYRLPVIPLVHWLIITSPPTALSTNRGISGTQSDHSHERPLERSRVSSRRPRSFPSFQTILSIFHVSIATWFIVFLLHHHLFAFSNSSR